MESKDNDAPPSVMARCGTKAALRTALSHQRRQSNLENHSPLGVWSGPPTCYYSCAMKQQAKNLWLRLLSSLWFVPGAMVLGAVLFAFVLVHGAGDIDRKALENFPRIFGAGADGSRAMLSAIAGSMITVAGVTFSITIVAVSQASSQYTPRILRNFMHDTANQISLGAFVGIFAYCLVVLRTIRSGNDLQFVPSIAVLMGVILALAGIGVLIFFIHHIATTLQASSVIQRVANDTLDSARGLLPRQWTRDDGDQTDSDAVCDGDWRPLPAASTGYLDAVDREELLELARECDVVLRMEYGVGEFVVRGQPIASACGRELGSEALVKLDDVYIISPYRTVQQDIAFGIRQLVDIALKALSPSINDPTTAVTSLDYIGAVLVDLVARDFGSRTLRDAGDRVRVLVRARDFGDLVELAFDEIRQNAEDNPRILLHMLRIIVRVGSNTRSPARLYALRMQSNQIGSCAMRGISSDHDRGRITAAVDQTLRAIAAPE